MHRCSPGLLLLTLSALAAACTELPSESTLDRTRILATRVEPAQPAPGEAVTWSSLAWAPDGPPVVVWCLPPACEVSAARAEDLAQTAWEDLSEEARQSLRSELFEEGVVGVEPGVPPALVAPDPGEAGSFFLAASAFPPDSDDVERATLDLGLASEGEPPNTHPEIAALLVDDMPVSDGIVVLPADTTSVLWTEVEGLQTYSVDGEARSEAASLRWYTDLPGESALGGPGPGGGGGPAGILADGTFEVTPGEGSGTLIAVARDGRGGVDWVEVEVRAE